MKYLLNNVCVTLQCISCWNSVNLTHSYDFLPNTSSTRFQRDAKGEFVSKISENIDKIDRTLRYPKNFTGSTSDIDSTMKNLGKGRRSATRTLSHTKNSMNYIINSIAKGLTFDFLATLFNLDSNFKRTRKKYPYDESQGSLLFTKHFPNTNHTYSTELKNTNTIHSNIKFTQVLL